MGLRLAPGDQVVHRDATRVAIGVVVEQSVGRWARVRWHPVLPASQVRMVDLARYDAEKHGPLGGLRRDRYTGEGARRCVRSRGHEGPCVEATRKPIFDRMKDGEFPHEVYGADFGVPGVSAPAIEPRCRKRAARHFEVPA